MAIVIHPNGAYHELTPDESDGTLSLESLQKAVGGYIERVVIPGDSKRELVVNEEGLFDPNRTLNPLASTLARQPLVGIAVLVEVCGKHGESWR